MTAITILEHKTSYGGKLYVTTNAQLSGRGITQCGDGSSHKRGLKTYNMTENAFNKIQASSPIKSTYISTDY